jgi:hypothetical protein
MYTKIIEALMLQPDMYSATYYESPKQTIRVTRRHSHKGRVSRREFVVTVGAPNYLAARFIKLAITAGEPFPIKKIQFQPFPVKRKKHVSKQLSNTRTSKSR